MHIVDSKTAAGCTLIYTWSQNLTLYTLYTTNRLLIPPLPPPPSIYPVSCYKKCIVALYDVMNQRDKRL